MKFKPYLISLLATAVPNALGFLAFPLYAKALGAADYGTVALLEAYQGILSILLFVGMGTAFYVFYSHAKEEQEQKQIFASSFFFGLWILAFALGVTSFSPQISNLLFQTHSTAPFVAIYAFALFSDYMLTLINSYLRVEGKISSLAINAIFISLVHHGLSFYVVVIRGGDIADFITIFMITKSSALLIVGYHIKRLNLPISRNFVFLPLLWKMLRFGAPLILTALTGWVLLLSDRLFINYYVTMTDVGIYAVAYKFAMGLWIGIVQPFMTVWEPSLFKVFQANAQEGYLKLKKDFTLYLGGIVILFSAFILFIGNILELIFAHSEYAHENTIIYLLTASYFLMAIGEMCASVCRLNKTSKFALWVTLAVISSKIALNIILIPRYLLIGAAAGSVIAELLAQVIMVGFAIHLMKSYKFFFSAKNAALFVLFCATECFLYVAPGATLVIKIAYFAGLLTIAAGLIISKIRVSVDRVPHQESSFFSMKFSL
ncbi:MAG: oligosaccharide flippase family protein [Parachlamydiaceae bacterium]|nr:oligosaccharide flippase family protein [Parachlamydiaceae bacterium]